MTDGARRAPHARSPVDTVRALVAALNNHDVERATGFFAPEGHNHGRPSTPETMRAVFLAQRGAVPDLHHEVEAIHQDGDVVVTRSMLSGTHTGVVPEPLSRRLFNGALADLEPSQRRFRIQAIHIWETAHGLIVGHWACRDDLGLRAQLQPETGNDPP